MPSSVFRPCLTFPPSLPPSLPLDEKRVLREAVERLGGVYTTDLEMDVTSFLIARRAEGDKYQAARKWNIRVVSRDWLQACERRKGKALPPSLPCSLPPSLLFSFLSLRRGLATLN